MAQINTPKAFDISTLDADTLQKLRPFIEYVNQNFDQVIRGLTNQLTLGENLRGRFVTITCRHATPVTIDVTQGVAAVLPFRVQGGELKAFNLVTDRSGRPIFTPFFYGPIPVQTRKMTVSAGFVTAEVKGTAGIGDTVTITGSSIAENNGEFLVIGTLTAPERIVYYNADGAADDRTSYAGVTETDKTVSLFVYYA